MTLAFCAFKNKLYIATPKTSKIITIEKADEIYKHFPNETPDKIITPGGPYPFTMLRILISTAYGFAKGHNVPCYLVKRFSFLNFVFPRHFFALETRRGDFFTYHEDLGEKLMSKEEALTFIHSHENTHPLVSDADIFEPLSQKVTFNLAEKLIEYYPQATILKDPYYFYTPKYKKRV